MSIWCSWEHIGTHPTDGKWKTPEGEPVPPEGAVRGNVLSYADGFSNHYPDLTGENERPACIELAHIAPWCTPGHSEPDVDYDAVGGWLRLEVACPEVVNYWEKDDDGDPTIKPEGATVVLDEEAVRALRDDLTAWLECAKVSARPFPVKLCAESDAE